MCVCVCAHTCTRQVFLTNSIDREDYFTLDQCLLINVRYVHVLPNSKNIDQQKCDPNTKAACTFGNYQLTALFAMEFFMQHFKIAHFQYRILIGAHFTCI